MHEFYSRRIDLKENSYGSQEFKDEIAKIDNEFSNNSTIDWYFIKSVKDTYKHFKTKKEAEDYLYECWHKDCDKSYMATYDFKRSQKYVSLKQRLKIEEKKLTDYKKMHSCSNFKSVLIGCDNCGSKIAKDYIKNDECPVCGHDLRSLTTKNVIKRYENNIRDLKEQIEDEEKAMTNKKSYEKYLTKGTLVVFTIETHV